MGRRYHKDAKITARQLAYLAALENWIRHARAENAGFDRDLVDIAFDDMLDEADPALGDRIAARRLARRERRAPNP